MSLMTYATLGKLRLVSLLVGVCSFLYLSTVQLGAANICVRTAAFGSANGSDWNNAMARGALNWSIINPGDTLWLAGGGTGPMQIQENNITVKRVLSTDAAVTGLAGWSSAFDSQVLFGVLYGGGGEACIRISSGSGDAQVHNVTINGRIPGGIKCVLPAPTGIDINTTAAAQQFGVLSIGSSNRVEYCEFLGPDSVSASAGISLNNKSIGPYLSTFYVGHCTFSKLGAGLFLGQCNGITVEYCTISESYGNGANHDNCLYIYSSSNGIFRYNTIRNWGAMGLYFSSVDTIDNWKIYGNTWRNTAGQGQAIGLDPSGGPSSVYGPNWVIYNNTFANVGIGIRGSGREGASTTGGTVRNNIFWNVGYDWGVLDHDYDFSNVSSGEANGIGNGTDPFLDLAGDNLHINSTISATQPRNKGTSLAAEYNTDPDGNSRTGLWSIGAYEYPGAGTPGALQVSAATAMPSEADGTLTVTLQRIGGSTGPVDVDYGTTAGTATAGVNYTTTTGTKSWGNGDAADKTFTVPLIDTDMVGNKTFTVTISNPTGGATLGQSSQEVTITGTGSEPTCLLSGLTFQATNACSITAPMTTNTTSGVSYVYQPTQTDYATGGRAVFTFTNSAGDYRIIANVNAPGDANNSFFISTNGAAADVWDIVTLTSGFDTRYISLRGNGAFDNPQYPDAVFSFGAGTNTITIGGREANVWLHSITLEPVAVAPPPVIVAISTTLTNLATYTAAYASAGSNVPIVISWSLPITVTGIPKATNTAGGLFTYQSTSDSTNTLWAYTVLAGHNSQLLDVTGINLDGGTIQSSGINADLSVPTPTGAGSLSAQQTVVVDTVAPVTIISAPTISLAYTGGSGSWLVTYNDLNMGRSPGLTESSVHLVTTGSAGGTLSVVSSPSTPTVLVSSITGTSGTLAINIDVGTTTDLAGNSSTASGPSSPITVSGGSVGRILQTRSGLLFEYPQ